MDGMDQEIRWPVLSWFVIPSTGLVSTFVSLFNMVRLAVQVHGNGLLEGQVLVQFGSLLASQLEVPLAELLDCLRLLLLLLGHGRVDPALAAFEECLGSNASDGIRHLHSPLRILRENRQCVGRWSGSQGRARPGHHWSQGWCPTTRGGRRGRLHREPLGEKFLVGTGPVGVQESPLGGPLGNAG